MKKHIFVLLIITVIFPFIMGNAIEVGSSEISVILDGTPLQFDVAPIIVSGRTLVPIRKIFETMDYDIEWDEQNQQIVATKCDLSIQIVIGNPVAVLSNRDFAVELDVPAQVIDGRTMIPLRFVSECLGYDVLWHEETQTALIYSRIPPYENSENLSYKEISASDSWIYWSVLKGIPGVIRSREDGSDCEWVLKGISSNDLIASDDYLYGRLSQRKEGLPVDLHLRSYNIKTKEFNDLSNQNVREIFKKGDWIEYSTFDENGGIRDTKSYKVKLDGSETIEIEPSILDYELNINPVGNWVSKRIEYKDNIFYAVSNYISESEPLTPIGICQTDKDGKLVNLFQEDKVITNIVVINNTIFFTKEDYGHNDNNLYRMDLEGKYKIKIAEHITQDFKIIGNYIYFYHYQPVLDGGYYYIEPLWRMNTDGTKQESLPDAWKIPDWDSSVLVSIG